MHQFLKLSPCKSSRALDGFPCSESIGNNFSRVSEAGKSRSYSRKSCVEVFAVNRKTRRHRARTGYYYRIAQIPKTEYPRPWLEKDQAETSGTDELNLKVSGMPTGMAVTWLGTSSGAPTLQRNVSSICVRWPYVTYVFDTGEGTQVQMLKSSIYPAYVRRIFITHLHGDHCFGLPGLLNLISKVREGHLRFDMVNIYGPPGLVKLLKMSLPFWRDQFAMPITVTEFCWDEESAHEPIDLAKNGLFNIAKMAPTSVLNNLDRKDRDFLKKPRSFGAKLALGVAAGYQWEIECENGVVVTAAQLKHRVPCWGYVVKEPDCLPDELDLLQHVWRDNDEEPPSAKPGRKVVILGDTCNSDALSSAARGADLVSHEATFGKGMEEKAAIAQHSTAFMAGEFARQIEAKNLVLTHFSPRYERPLSSIQDDPAMRSLLNDAKQGFQSNNVRAASDFFTYHVRSEHSDNEMEDEMEEAQQEDFTYEDTASS